MRKWVAVVALFAILFPLGAFVGSVFAQIVAGSGTAVIRDDKALSDGIVVRMTGVAPPATGTAYEGWLDSADGRERQRWGLES